MPWDKKCFLSKDELYHLYIEKKLSMNQIAKNFSLGSSTIFRKMKEFNISSRKPKEARWPHFVNPSKKQLYDDYIIKQLSARQIAKKYSLGRTSVFRWLEKYNIPRRDKIEMTTKFLLSKDELFELYINQKLSYSQIANKLNLSRYPIKYWLKKYGIDIREKAERERLKVTPEYCEKNRKNRMKAKFPHFLSKPEQKFIEIIKKYNLPFKHVGNGAFWVENINPDFIETNERKLAVEIFGDYWHSLLYRPNLPYSSTEQGRKEIYAKNGWESIIIWESELKNEQIILDKISN